MTFIVPEPVQVISGNNSSSLPLNASTSFTGIGEDVSRFSSMSVQVNSDQDGTLNIEFSTDNSNWDLSESFPSHDRRVFDWCNIL